MAQEQSKNRVQNQVDKWHVANKETGARFFAQRKLQHYERVLQEFEGKNELSADERRALANVRKAVARLDRDLRPGGLESGIAKSKNPVARFLYEFLKTIRENRAIRHNAGFVRITGTNAPSKRPPAPPRPLPQISSRDALRQVLDDFEMRGFGHKLPQAIERQIELKASSFTLEKTYFGRNGALQYAVEYTRSPTGRYYPDRLQGTFRKPVSIPSSIVDGINLGDLEKRMRNIDWHNKDYFDAAVPVAGDPGQNARIIKAVNGIFKDLFALKTSSQPDAVAAHDLLAYRYFSGTPNARMVSNMEELEKKFAARIDLPMAEMGKDQFTTAQVYNMIQGRAVRGTADANGQAPWYSIDINRADKNGVALLKAIPDSTHFKLDELLNRYGIDTGIKHRLEQGESLVAELSKNDVRVTRSVYADPRSKDILVDLKESEMLGLYKPPARVLRADLDKYLVNGQSRVIELEAGAGKRAILDNLNDETTENVHRGQGHSR
jgi:hypothetical protein